MKTYTIAEIRASYEQKRDWERQFPASYYLFRPLSFPLTALLSRLTNSPQSIAWAGLAVGAAACGLLAWRGSYGPWPGVAGLALFALLDACDGNMARVTGSVSRYGKLLDGALGKLVEGLYLPALSFGIYSSENARLPWSLACPSHWLLLSGFAALAGMLYSSYIESAYDAIRNEAGGRQRDVNSRIGSSRFRGNVFYGVFINLHAFNLQVLLLAAAALAGREDVFLFLAAGYYLVRMALLFPYYLAKGRTELG
jgi:phosphatidylglycerophosphate synthase